MGNRIAQTGTFTAVSDDGRRFTLTEYTTFHEGHTADGPYSTAGTKRLRTSDGSDVNRVAKGEYEVVGANGILRIRSSDPNAP